MMMAKSIQRGGEGLKETSETVVTGITLPVTL